MLILDFIVFGWFIFKASMVLKKSWNNEYIAYCDLFIDLLDLILVTF